MHNVLYRETWSWDVRTKHIQCEPIPTVEGVRGLANYGSQATLFTLGPDYTVQQYELSPARMVKQARFNPMLPPPVPQKSNQSKHIPGAAPPMAVPSKPDTVSERSGYSDRGGRSERSGPVSFSTIQRAANEMSVIEQARRERSAMASPTVSTSSRADSISSLSSNRLLYPRQGPPSISSRAPSGTTFSTMSPSMLGRDSMISGTSMYASTYSMASSGRRSKGSRLQQEVLRSPESHYIDLFPRTRSRLANVAYKEPAPIDQDNMTPDDLRRQMLDVVFGWEDDIEPLIRDELLHHQQGSPSAVLLSKWLGEVDSDTMAAAISSGNVNSADWMLLALSSMGGNTQMGKMGQAFVQRLLQQGDFHTSATILLGMGSLEDAVEVYVSRCFYMEAILLTSLIFPTDWQRQAHLVQKWGEFVVENSQQNLAMRCFHATGVEPPLPWGAPSPKMIDMQSRAPSSIGSMLSPPISPPPGAAERQPRMTPKTSSLKVITSFENPMHQQLKFPGLNSTDRTPTNGPGVTPIAESAISAGATPGGFTRSQLRGLNRMNTPGGAYSRNRLPSIGETPVDVTLPPFPRPSQLPTPDNSGSDLEKEQARHSKLQPIEDKSPPDGEDAPPLLLSSARYEGPTTPATGQTPMTAVPQTSLRTAILPSPAKDAFTIEKESMRARNASRDRKPQGLHIRMPSQDQIQTTHRIAKDGVGLGPPENAQSTTLSSLHSGGLLTGGLSTGRSDAMSESSFKSPSISGQSWASAKSPSISGRSIDQYISSLDEARSHPVKQKYSSRKRHESRDGRSQTGEHKSRSKHRAREQSEDRGRDNRRYIRPGKRSPRSPVPMSPENYTDTATTPGLTESISGMRSPDMESRDGRSEAGRRKGVSKLRSGSKASEYSHRTVRHRSPEGSFASGIGSTMSSRQTSPRAMLDPHGRGRSESVSRGGSAVRSPSSPLPLSPQAKHYQRDSSEEDHLRFVKANRQRIGSRHRSSSRKPKSRATSTRRDMSQDRRRQAEDRYTRASETDEQLPQSAIESRGFSGEQMLSLHEQPKLPREKLAKGQKRELAARELAARRESLLRNPEAPVVPHPDEFKNGRPNVFSRSHTELSNSPTSWNPVVPSNHPQRVDGGDIVNRSGAASVGPYGLPATPRAMRHPRYDNKEAIPAVPEFPEDVPMLPETYYTSARDLPRSMSAPIPEPQLSQSDLPPHPAFHKGLQPKERRGSNFQPLGNIGQHRRKTSGDQQSMMHPQVAGIEEMLHAAEREDPPPILPELQHLNMAPPPPPPPPPAPFSNRHDAESSSLSSNSNVGMIQMVLDNEPEDEANVIEVPPPPPPPPAPPKQGYPFHPAQGTRLPPIDKAVSPPPSMRSSSSNHRRGRSGDQFTKGIKGITERLRSSSRGRMTKSPEQTNTGPAPYESVPPLYF